MTIADLRAPALEFLDISGYRMAYRQWGDTSSTEAVLLIHGITSSSLSWIRVAPHLAEHGRVIAVDLKGHGDSDRPADGYRLAHQADEVAALVQALGLRSVSLMGHSWGGAISVVIAARNALSLTCVVLEDPAVSVGRDDPARRQQTIQGYTSSVGLSREEAEQRVRASAAPGWTEDDIQGKIDASVKASPTAVGAVFEANGHWDLTAELAGLNVPTLIVRADVGNGGIVPESVLQAALANPRIEVVTIPGADHNIHRGCFDAFMAAAEPFLSRAPTT